MTERYKGCPKKTNILLCFLHLKNPYSNACTGIFPKQLCTSQASDVIYFSHNKEYNHAQTSVKDREKMFEID